MNMSGSTQRFSHLGPFSDLVDAARAMRPLFPLAPPGRATQRKAREVLSFTYGDEAPLDVGAGHTWIHDGVRGEAVSWSVGYGPRTDAWLFTPEEATWPLPGLVALHDHGHFKFFGKEQIAVGPVAVGVAVGLIGALALTRVLRTLLTGISTSDPWVFALASASMFAVAVVAALQPALRAAGLDPTRALRAE